MRGPGSGGSYGNTTYGAILGGGAPKKGTGAGGSLGGNGTLGSYSRGSYGWRTNAGGGSAGAAGSPLEPSVYTYEGKTAGWGGPAVSGKSFVNGGAGLSNPATIGAALTLGTFYGSQV